MEHKTRRTVLKTTGSAAVLGTVAGCLGGGGGEEDGDDNESAGNESDDSMDEEEEMAMANLRVAHLSPDAPNVDVYVDGDAVLEDVPYRAVSEYMELETGAYDVMITAAGDQDTVVFDDELEVPKGDFIVAALGELAEENQPFAPAVLEDDLSDPGEMARVRLVHASPDAPAVDVTVHESGDALFEDVAFAEASAAEVPAGSYTLEVRPATENNDGDVAATFDVEVMSGGVYTAFATGYLAPADAPADEPFDLEVAVDAEAESN
jgi:predicted RNA-binding protein